MRRAGIRTGSFAILLAVIAVCMTVLGLLSIAAADADMRISRRHADMIKLRYELEADGQLFLCRVRESVLSGKPLDADKNGIIWKELQKDGCTLTIGLRINKDRSIAVTCWKFSRIWKPEEGSGSLWDGQQD